MPTYDRMKKNVANSPGIDITAADVDLLPWAPTTKRLNAAEYHRLQRNSLTELSRRKRSQSLQRDDPEAAKAAAAAAKEATEQDESAKRLEARQAAREARKKAAQKAKKKQDKADAEKAARKKAEEEAWKRHDDEMARKAAAAAAQKAEQEELARLEAEAAAAAQAKRVAEEKAARQAALRAEKERRQKEAAEYEARQAAEEAERQSQAAEATRAAAAEQERAHKLSQPPATTYGKSAIERVYRVYDTLQTPTRTNMVRALEQTEGLDITENDVNLLPWNEAGTALDWAKMHELLEKASGKPTVVKKQKNGNDGGAAPSTPPAGGGKGKIGSAAGLPVTPKSIMAGSNSSNNSGNGHKAAKNVSFTPRSTKGTVDHIGSPSAKKVLWASLDDDERFKRKAFGWYLTLGRPSRSVMEAILENTTGATITLGDVAKLPWNKGGQDGVEADTYVEVAPETYVLEAEMVLENDGKSTNDDKKNEARRQRQVASRTREDKARAKEAAALQAWQAKQPAAPAVPKNADSKTAGDVTTAYRWYRTLGSPTKETMLTVLAETKGVPLAADQVEALPWTQEDRALDHEQLAQLLKEEAQDAAKNDSGSGGKGKPDLDPRVLAAILKAYREYKGLGIPKFITFATIVDETTGLESTYEDISELPWDEDKLFVDEDRMAELQKQYDDYMSTEKQVQELRARRAAERQKRREAMRKQAQEEARRKQSSLEEAESKDKHQDMPLFLRDRISIREIELSKAKDRGDHKGWEESRALKAYSWYTRMTGPNRKRLKQIVSSMKECDIVPDDVDLLPWSPSGGWVDHVKIAELSSRRKDIVY